MKHLPYCNLLLTQSKYIRELLYRANMTDVKGISSPMASSYKLSKHDIDTMSNLHLYRSMVGSLRYANLTWSEITYIVNKVCQFMENLLESHWKEVKRILRYLKGSQHYGLLLQPTTPSPRFSINAFNKENWASDPDDRKSTSG